MTVAQKTENDINLSRREVLTHAFLSDVSLPNPRPFVHFSLGLACPYLFRFAARSTISRLSRMTHRARWIRQRDIGSRETEQGGDEVIGERGKQKRERRREKSLSWTRKDETTFSFLPRIHRHRDSARLPKLCLDLNRSRLEKYLPCLKILRKYFNDSEGYFSRVMSIFYYASAFFS